jgi:hypothetical protein
LLSLSVAFHAIAIAEVAIANIGAAMHKDRAFQASSPKNFRPVARPAFFLAAISRTEHSYRRPTHEQNYKSGAEAAGKTGTGRTIGVGVERFGYAPPIFPSLENPQRVASLS